MDGDTEISVVVEICGTDARTNVLATHSRPPRCPNSHSDAPNYPSPLPPKTSATLLSPCAGQTNSVHLGFPERTVDSPSENSSRLRTFPGKKSFIVLRNIIDNNFLKQKNGTNFQIDYHIKTTKKIIYFTHYILRQ